MFYLDLKLANIASAKDIHLRKFKCYVARRIGIVGCNLPRGRCSICDSRLTSVHNLNPAVVAFLGNPTNLAEILAGDPATLFSINSRFWTSLFPAYNYQNWRPYFDKRHIHSTYNGPFKLQATQVFDIIKQLKEIFNYDWFIEKKNFHYNAYDLCEKLDRNTCTYCNRSYISTVVRKGNGKCITRPTLDHWFPKSDFPLLAVSFQNLIPSCYSCNSSVKGVIQLNLVDHIHPYVDANQNDDFQFGYFYSTKLDKYRVFVQDTFGRGSKARDTLKSMYVDEVYNVHHTELNELLSIKKNYSRSYIASMHKLLGQQLTKGDVYRLLFGVYYENKDFHKRPLSKFKYDILKQLDMLLDI